LFLPGKFKSLITPYFTGILIVFTLSGSVFIFLEFPHSKMSQFVATNSIFPNEIF